MVGRVLVVDDYQPWVRLIRSMLPEAWELQVIAEASDGREAVQKAIELQPDLILLDIGLPALNGIEAARQIRQHNPKARILFRERTTLSGCGQGSPDHGIGLRCQVLCPRELLPCDQDGARGRAGLSVPLCRARSSPILRLSWNHPKPRLSKIVTN